MCPLHMMPAVLDSKIGREKNEEKAFPLHDKKSQKQIESIFKILSSVFYIQRAINMVLLF